MTDQETTRSEHCLKIDIPTHSVTVLGFRPHAPEYQGEVLRSFSPAAGVRWHGIGRNVRRSDGGDRVEKIVWTLGVADIEEALEGLRAMFRERSFPDGTTVTRVAENPDGSFAFETLLTWRCA
jgi:hypothetical protein